MIHDTFTIEWSFRDEILLITHRWPIILLFCLVGSLVGWIISFCSPSPHRATKELYVGLNVYRATEDRNAAEHAGIQFSNPNDYKNWQMANLNSLIFMDAILEQTLNHLSSLDPYWSSIDQKELAEMLHAYWRNAGKWRLVAENADPQYAAQAVLAWENVVVNHVHNAVEESRNVMLLDSQLQSITLTQAQATSRTVELAHIHEALKSWQAHIVDQDKNRPVNEIDRRLASHLVDRAHLGSSGQGLLETFPPSEAPLQDYITWLDSVFPILEQELLILQDQIVILENKENEIATSYAIASQNSLGLSANLQVDKITTAPPEHTVVRPTGLLILIGGLLGLMMWAILWVTKISLQARK